MRIIELCRNESHVGPRLHIARRSREECDARDAAMRADADFRQDAVSWESLERERQDREADAAAAEHQPAEPANGSEAALLRNGERQLLHALGGWYSVAELLLTSDIYRINDLLRRGQSLLADPGAMLDWNGYESLQAFTDDANAMFEHLGDTAQLDEPVRVYRGVGVAAYNEWDPFDFWDLRKHLLSGGPSPGTVLTDPGFAFASPTERIARYYDGSDARVHDVQSKVLLELTVTRGLCVPAPEHRSTELTRALHPFSFLRDAMPQIIIPPDSTWTVNGTRPLDDTGWARFALVQG